MSLSAGTLLGPYEVVSLIGAGGMGEVYKARDQRLGRDVAVKVLPASFAADPERLRRFEQEARAVAALSHPNIVAVHDIGQYQGRPFLVSELLEGESLRELLLRGALSQRKAIDYGVQVAHGLAAAHSKQIAHRDLKPDNLFLTREGRVKILDFGLAKTVQKAPVVHDSRTVMTELGPATDVGAVVGTVGYMSPEQVRGEPVDCRTDIFSFGAVLYEMLTGVRAFRRDTAAETMTAILKEDPPELSLTGPAIAPGLERTVRHCLEKAPEQRFQSARDLAFDLESFSTLTPSGTVTATKVKAAPRWWYAVATAAVLAVAGLVAWRIAARPAAVSARFRQVTFRRGELDTARYTPDGQNIVYTAALEGAKPELYTVAAKSTGGHPLGIRDARLLAVSPKGDLAVALSPHNVTSMVVIGDLARTSGDNSAPKPEIENVIAADFSPQDGGLAIVRWISNERICQLEYPIGKVLGRMNSIDDVRFSRSGQYLAFIARENAYDDRGRIIVLRSTGEKVVESPIFESAQGLAWTPHDDEVWITSPLEAGAIHAFNLQGKLRSPLDVPGRLFLRDIAPDGTLLAGQGIYRRGNIVSTENGKIERDISWLDFSYGRAISKDGTMVLFDEEGGESGDYTVFVRNVDGSPAVAVGSGYSMAISPDKKWALGQRLTEPTNEVWLLPVGPGEARRISPPNLVPWVWASFLSDGKRIVYIAQEQKHTPRTWLQDLKQGNPKPITDEGITGWMVSPDDKWLLAGSGPAYPALINPVVVPLAGDPVVKVAGLQPGDNVLGWTTDGRVYVQANWEDARSSMHVLKVNPFTGARTPWRDLGRPVVGNVAPQRPFITPDGSAYLYGYVLELWDLYTVDGVH